MKRRSFISILVVFLLISLSVQATQRRTGRGWCGDVLAALKVLRKLGIPYDREPGTAPIGNHYLLPILERAQAGDVKAQERLIRTLTTLAWPTILRTANYDADLAQDALQEFFIRVKTDFLTGPSPRKFSDKDRLFLYFRTMARNATLTCKESRNDQLRIKHGPKIVLDEVPILNKPQDEDPLLELISSEKIEAIDRIVEALPEPGKSIIKLKIEEHGIWVEQISERLNIPVRTVERRLKEAREQLQRAIDNLE